MIDLPMASSVEQRWRTLGVAGHNVVRLRPEDVVAELSTDARPSAEVGPGAAPPAPIERIVWEVLGHRQYLPAHLGRGAEAVVASLVQPGQSVLANEVYVTCGWSVARRGGTVLAIPTPAEAVAGGDLDLDILERELLHRPVALVWVTAPRVLLSDRGGSPVSPQNLEAIRRLLDRVAPDVPLVLDASRLGENSAAAVLQPESSVRSPRRGTARAPTRGSISAVARAMARCADIVVLSARKDVGCSQGGLVAMSGDRWSRTLANLAGLLEGSPDSGGLSADELAALATGLGSAFSDQTRTLST